MKKFINKITEITVEEEGKERALTYAELIKICTDNPPKEGFTTSIMKERLDAQKAISGVMAGETVEIEDAVSITMQECVKGFSWAMMHKNLIELEEDILNMEKI